MCDRPDKPTRYTPQSSSVGASTVTRHSYKFRVTEFSLKSDENEYIHKHDGKFAKSTARWMTPTVIFDDRYLENNPFYNETYKVYRKHCCNLPICRNREIFRLRLEKTGIMHSFCLYFQILISDIHIRFPFNKFVND
jgi:hypothetical protein